MTKIKGLFKGIRFISQIFVFKEHEMEIGHPTDVRHVAHIGYDSGSSMSSPSWMKEFKTSSDFSLTSLGNFGQSRGTSKASQDFDRHARQQAPVDILSNQPCAEGPKVSKKMRRKKPKSSSPSSTSRSSTKSSKMRSSCAASVGGINDGIPQEILVN